MIINTGQRTDIPAFYSEWFANRLKEGYVCVRNPFNPEQVSKYRLDPSNNRPECSCYIACDIGAYDSCMHLCKYCYANNDREKVIANYKAHDINSPFLIGGCRDGDIVHEITQKSWIDNQISLNLF